MAGERGRPDQDGHVAPYTHNLAILNPGMWTAGTDALISFRGKECLRTATLDEAGTSMRRRILSSGQWVGTGYIALILGTVIGGFAGATEWYDIVAAFAVAMVVALVIGYVIGLLDSHREARGG